MLKRFFLLMVAIPLGTSQWLFAKPLSLNPADYKHLPFADIKPTRYRLIQGILHAEVKQSASALILPFREAQSVKGFKIEWIGEGNLAIKNAAAEEQKAGDDAWFRLGFVLSGPAPAVPFLAPAWIKVMDEMLQLPGNRLIYYHLGAKHPAWKSWPNPYHDEITCVSVPSKLTRDGWKSAEVTFGSPLKTVALWLMADGDNTSSEFTTQIRQMTLIP